jgi:DNA primase
MADQIEEVKQKSDIVSVISSFITLKKAGRNYKALCPFHSEKTPSFMISPELQIYKCFGCGDNGDVYSFLEKYEGMEFTEALKYLADKAGIKLKPLSPGQFGEKERLLEINKISTRFYNYVLLNHKAGKDALYYLTRERGLKIDTLKKFQLGFSPYKPDALANYLISKKNYHQTDLLKLGLVYKGRYGLADRFLGRLIFPLFDHRGNVVGFAGRILPKDENKEKAKYINSPETPLYHKSRILYGLDLAKAEIKKSKKVVIVEGELDMISSWQAGIKNVVAIKGSALTEEQVSLISRFSQKMILALDSDFAGDTAARKGIATAFSSGIEIRVANLKDYKDPDEMARKNPEGLAECLEKAVGIWDFFVNSVFAKHNINTGEGKAKISREIVPLLSSIPDRIVQAHYIDIVASKLNVPVSAVSDEVLKTKPSLVVKEESASDKPLASQEKKGRRDLLEERLMILLFRTNPKLLLEKSHNNLLKDRLNLKLIDELRKYFAENKEFDNSKFSKDLPSELFDGFSKIVLSDVEDLTKDTDKLEKEIRLVEREIEILIIKENISKLSKKIGELEKLKDKETFEKSKRKFLLLTRKLNELEESKDKGIIF